MQKKAKIAKLVHDMCKSVTEQMGNFIVEFAKIDEEEPDNDPPPHSAASSGNW